MNDYIAIFLASSLFTISGWKSGSTISGSGYLEKIGLSFLIGSGLTTYIWYLLYLIGIPLNLMSVLLSAIILFLVSMVIHLIKKPAKTKYNDKKISSNIDKKLIIVISLLLLGSLVIATYSPLTAWDSIALYDFRAHVIASSHSLNDFIHLSYYVSYPLMISLVHSVVYMLGGTSAQGIHSVFFMSFIAIAYGRLKSLTNVRYALIGVLLIVLQYEIFNHSTFAYTNLPYTTYLISGFLYCITPQLGVAAILIALSGWMRFSEVFWLIGVLLVIVESIRLKKVFQGLLLIIFILAIRFGWSHFVSEILSRFNQVEESRINHFTLNNFIQIYHNRFEISKYIYRFIIYPYFGYWFMAFPTMYTSFMKRNYKLKLLSLSLVASAGISVFGVMIFSTYFETWNQIGDSARRMMLFIIPLSIISATYSLFIVRSDKTYEK